MEKRIVTKPNDTTLVLTDLRDGRSLLNGGDLSLSYTRKDEDITKGERQNGCSPYDSHEGKLIWDKERKTLRNEEFQSTLSYETLENGIVLTLEGHSSLASEYGLNLPFDFMGKKNSGHYPHHYLFTSPYRSLEDTYQYVLLEKPDGNDLLVVFLSPVDGWKMDYSPYVGGHYFTNLKVLSSFDRAYHTDSTKQLVKVGLFPVSSLREALEIVTRLLKVPAVYYEKSYSFDGRGEVEIIGPCDQMVVKTEEKEERFPVTSSHFTYQNAKRKTYLIPYWQGKRGLDASVWTFEDPKETGKKVLEHLFSRPDFPPHDNLCEGACYASAALRYMKKYGENAFFMSQMEKFFSLLMATDESKAIPDLTIFNQPQNGYPAYHLYRSSRIQEQAFGITIFQDAYELTGKDIYYEYATKALNTLLDTYQKEDGRLETSHAGTPEDYSTVCCPLIPIVDMALLTEKKDPVLARKYHDAAYRLASYIAKRGFHFPTEGGDSPLAEEQMEDGSISCSALALLYYCAKIERKEEWIALAKKILDFHETWVMKTPDCNVYRSSLRWWETRWEGDGDGPALCCGHGWTIWRSEADYWYAVLTGDSKAMENALSGFATNFAKIGPNGEEKAIYQMDFITGGGFFEKKDIRYRVAPRFPDADDIKVSFYAWIRAFETILS